MIFSTTLEMKDTLTIGRKLPGSVGSIPSRLMTGIRMDLFWALARLLPRWIDCKLLLGVAAICPGSLAGGTSAEGRVRSTLLISRLVLWGYNLALGFELAWAVIYPGVWAVIYPCIIYPRSF